MFFRAKHRRYPIGDCEEGTCPPGYTIPVTSIVRETFLLIRISKRSDQGRRTIVNWGQSDHKREIKEDYF